MLLLLLPLPHCVFTDGFNKLQSLLRTWNFPFEPRLCFDPKLRSKCTKNPHTQSEHLLTGSSRLPRGLAAPMQDDASPSASHTPPTAGEEGWREGGVDRLAENMVFLMPSYSLPVGGQEGSFPSLMSSEREF